MREWEEILRDPRYQALPPEKKDALQWRYLQRATEGLPREEKMELVKKVRPHHISVEPIYPPTLKESFQEEMKGATNALMNVWGFPDLYPPPEEGRSLEVARTVGRETLKMAGAGALSYPVTGLIGLSSLAPLTMDALIGGTEALSYGLMDWAEKGKTKEQMKDVLLFYVPFGMVGGVAIPRVGKGALSLVKRSWEGLKKKLTPSLESISSEGWKKIEEVGNRLLRRGINISKLSDESGDILLRHARWGKNPEKVVEKISKIEPQDPDLIYSLDQFFPKTRKGAKEMANVRGWLKWKAQNPLKISGPESVERLVNEWFGGVSESNVLAAWAKEDVLSIPGAKNRKVREAITHYIESGFKDPDGLDERQLSAAREISHNFDLFHQIAEKEGLIDAYRTNYVTHLFSDNPKKIEQYVGTSIPTRFKFSRSRTLEGTLREIKEKFPELHPITDIAEIYSTYVKELQRTITNKRLIQALSELRTPEGKRILLRETFSRGKKGSNIPRGWKQVDDRIFKKYSLRTIRIPKSKGGGKKSVMIESNVYAPPEVAKLLNDITKAYLPYSAWQSLLKRAQNVVKRLIMLNPLVHGLNILSDVIDEVGFSPTRTFRLFREGSRMWKNRDAGVLEFARAGGKVQTADVFSNELTERLTRMSPVLEKVLSPVLSPFRLSDKFLFQGIVRNAQLGLYGLVKSELSRLNPYLSEEQLRRSAASYVNTMFGTLPPHYYTHFGRELSSALLFARDWTFSNLRLMSGAVGKRGAPIRVLSNPSLSEGERLALQSMYRKHIAKGIFALLAGGSLLQMLSQVAASQLSTLPRLPKKPTKRELFEWTKALLERARDFDSDEVKRWWEEGRIRPMWMNEEGKLLHIGTGFRNEKGQEIYVVPHFFRYIRDLLEWASHPLHTTYNKLEPLVKSLPEALYNYSIWKGGRITDRQDLYGNVRDRSLYVLRNVTPWRGIVEGISRESSEFSRARHPVEDLAYLSGTMASVGLTYPYTAFTSLPRMKQYRFLKSLPPSRRKELLEMIRKRLMISGDLAHELHSFRLQESALDEEARKKADLLRQKGEDEKANEVLLKRGFTPETLKRGLLLQLIRERQR